MSGESVEGTEDSAAPAPPAAPPAAPPVLPAVAAPTPTGDERVDTALARLGELGGTQVSEHVEVFEDVHQRLQDILTSVDQQETPTPQAVPRPPGPGHTPPGQGHALPRPGE